MSSSETEDISLEGTPKPGEIFADKYRIDRVLGVGGMGVVLAATHIHLQEKAAIKVLLPMHATRQETVARFLREGRAAVKIRSEHVGRVIDVGTHAGLHYIVMEYLDGLDLSDVLKRDGRLPWAIAVDYVLQASEAIAEAHAMHTVHRDLKPANLFLIKDKNGAPCIKVLDFGISKMTEGNMPEELAMTRTASILGSPLYMSPEQLRSSKAVDERADIWAIGVMLYELIVGTPPFQAETIAVLGALVLSGHVPDVRERVPEAPEALAHAIQTCLRSEVMERFPSLVELAIAIGPFGTQASQVSVERIKTVLKDVPRPPSSFTGVRPKSSSSVELAAFAKLSTSSSNPSLPTQPSNWGSITNPYNLRKRSPAFFAAAGAAAVAVLVAGIAGVVHFVGNRPASVGIASPTVSLASTTIAPSSLTIAPEPTASQAPSVSVSEPAPTQTSTTSRAQPRSSSSRVTSTAAPSATKVPTATTAAPAQSAKTNTGFAKDRYD
jgi:serine/threonine-protein kinase